MNKKEIFDRLWTDYSNQNPSVKRIHDLFEKEDESIENDHIAFRTFNDPKIGVDILSKPFLGIGYEEKGQYHFEEKKLFAKHFEHPSDHKAPKIFISELKLEEFSTFLQDTIRRSIDFIPEEVLKSEHLLFSGNQWGKPSYEIYEQLKTESEYAAWLYVYGFRANHFTIFSNFLRNYESLEDLNDFLKNKGFKLNASGGEIKGTPEQLLEQSSTLADIIKVDFIEGRYDVPACYYEFARRYTDENGKLYSGFIAKSADKIFESTNYYK